MEAIAKSDDPLDGTWGDGPIGWRDSFAPATGKASWGELPKLTDIFPWQQPGCMHSRLWPIAPDEETLRSRWDHFVKSKPEDRPALYVTPASGRSILTKVEGLTELVNLKEGAAPQPLVRYGFRSFDREWTYNDPRLAKTESPALWSSVSDKQVFLVSLTHAVITKGPSMTATECVPDKHYFKGSSGGKNVLPLYRDAAATRPNITSGLPEVLASHIGISTPAPEDIAAYVYAVLSSPAYREIYTEEMKTPGPRVPITLDKGLWTDAVRMGKRLLWLHTYATRFQNDLPGNEKQGKTLPSNTEIGWDKSVTVMPDSLADIRHNDTAELLYIGDGVVSGVTGEVWSYSVSGMQIVKKWLGYRTKKGAGRAASSKNPLDKIRPTGWKDLWNTELLELLRVIDATIRLHKEQADVVKKIAEGLTISADELPQPKPAERKPPRV